MQRCATGRRASPSKMPASRTGSLRAPYSLSRAPSRTEASPTRKAGAPAGVASAPDGLPPSPSGMERLPSGMERSPSDSGLWGAEQVVHGRDATDARVHSLTERAYPARDLRRVSRPLSRLGA